VIIEQTRFGTINIEPAKIITMVRTLPGFPDRKRFVILNREESRPFLWFQSVDDPRLAFVIINPFLFIPDYQVDFKGTSQELGWEIKGKEESGNLSVFVLVNAASGSPENISVNLMAPLLIHMERFEAVQLIMQDSGYPHKHPLFKKERYKKENVSNTQRRKEAI
jgi:flagellar assembly factor FliW